MRLLRWAMSVAGIAVISLSSYAVAGEEKTGEELLLDEVVVTATKTERKVTEIPASVTVITKEEIEKVQVIKPEELLKNTEGVDIKTQAGGLPSVVMLRGIPSSFAGATTQILVDGMAVEPVLITNRMAWHLVEPDDIERIEVVRGPASALYGPNAVGGVINIITKKGEGAPSLGVRAGYGTHDSHIISASLGGTATCMSAIDFRVGASEYKTDGFVAQPEPDMWGSRDLAGRDYRDRKFNARLGYTPAEGHEISLGYNYFDVDGAWFGGHPNNRFHRYGYLTDLSYKGRISPVLDLKARLMRADYRTTDTFDWDYWGDTGNLDLAETRREDEEVWGGELQADIHAFTGNTITAGLSYSRGDWKVRSEDTTGMPTGDTASKSSVTGLFLQDEQRLGDVVILTLGGRYDRYSFFDDLREGATFPDSEDDVFNPRAGVRVNVTKTTSLYASAGTAYLPALNTLKFRSRGGRFIDNPDLKPEKSASYEAGANQNIGGILNARISLFHTDYKDMIASVITGMNWQFQNIGKVEVKGMEIGLEGVIGDSWYPFANYTFTDAEITKSSDPLSVGMRPAFIAKHKFNVGITYDNPDIITARLAGRYVGDRFFDNRNTDKAGGFFVADAKITKKLPFSGMMKDLALSFAVNNIFNKEYSEFPFERADERNCWVEVSFRF